MIRIKMNEIIKTFGVLLAVAILAIGLVLPQPASAALPAPKWLPGQPLLAGSQVIAMWLPVPGAVKYVLYLNGEKIAESPANQYMGFAPDTAGDHIYEVTSVDAAGAESQKSTAGIIKIIMIEPPKGIFTRLDTDTKSVLLRWDRSQGAAIYNVYRSTSPEGPFEMVNSQVEFTYKDRNLELGKFYYYAVSAKDTIGKESNKSAVIEVMLEEIITAKSVKPPVLRILPTALAEFYAKWPGSEARLKVDVLIERFDLLFSTDGGSIHVLEKDMQHIDSYPISVPEDSPKEWRGLSINNFDMISDDEGVANDMFGGRVFFFTLASGVARVEQVHVLRKPTQDEKPQVFKDIPKSRRVGRVEPMGIVAVDPDTVWAFGFKSQLLFVVDRQEGVIDWKIGYQVADKDKNQSWVNVIQVIPTSDGDFLLFTSLGRKVVRIDGASADQEVLKAKWETGTASYSGYIGKFLGMNGATIYDDKKFIVGDPAMKTVQVFDVETGKYLYSIGDKTGQPDLKNSDIAVLEVTFPAYPYIFPDGERLAIYQPFEKSWYVFTILDEGGVMQKQFTEEALKPDEGTEGAP